MVARPCAASHCRISIMLIGVLTVRIEIGESQSLKDKRMVVRSLITRIRDKLNVSAAEVDDLDVWQRATMGFAVISNDGAHNDQVLDKVVRLIENEPRCTVLDIEHESI
jgi:uncharacterized protein YlxP (DUF503 family)